MKRMTILLLALLTVTGPAQALTVSIQVGPLLKEAQQMIAAKNYDGAAAALDEAEAVKVSDDDTTVINMMRQALAKASSPPSQP